jgi:histidyl-tRNA synthetase
MKNFQTVKGMRDFAPKEMEKRQFVLDTIRKVFESWGYRPLDTPALESFALLACKGGGGEEVKKEIYYFKDQAKRELGLRFDLTVPLARFVVANPNLPKPFKRYQFGKVWRYDRPQADRFREFQQTDVDILGTASPKADAEIVAVACDVFKSLGFKKFVIRISNRKILDYFVRQLGIKDPVAIFRAVDKLDKIGKQGVADELAKVTTEKNVKAIVKFVSGTAVPQCAGKSELDNVISEIKKLGYGKNVKVDLSLVRGLEYYTGTVLKYR